REERLEAVRRRHPVHGDAAPERDVAGDAQRVETILEDRPEDEEGTGTEGQAGRRDRDDHDRDAEGRRRAPGAHRPPPGQSLPPAAAGTGAPQTARASAIRARTVPFPSPRVPPPRARAA